MKNLANCISLSSFEQAFYGLPEDKKNAELIKCVEEMHDPEIFDFCLKLLNGLSENEVVSNLKGFLTLKVSNKTEIRILVSEKLASVSVVFLADNLGILFDSLRSRITLERMEAEVLLSKIPAALLSPHFEFIRNQSNANNFDVCRLAKNCLIKIVNNWSVSEKKEHFDYISELRESPEPNLKKLGNASYLQIVNTWGRYDERLPNLIPFFKTIIKNGYDTEISDLAGGIMLFVLKDFCYQKLLPELDTLTEFLYSGNKELRRGYRKLFLTVMNLSDESLLPKYAHHLLRCLESSNKYDVKSAYLLLLKIDPNLLSVQDLVNCQACGLYRVRKVGRKLAKRIGKEKLLENLEFFFNSQQSQFIGVRRMATNLAISIPFEMLEGSQLVKEKINSIYFLEQKLARELVF